MTAQVVRLRFNRIVACSRTHGLLHVIAFIGIIPTHCAPGESA
jgi:hypothetical protein